MKKFITNLYDVISFLAMISFMPTFFLGHLEEIPILFWAGIIGFIWSVVRLVYLYFYGTDRRRPE